MYHLIETNRLIMRPPNINDLKYLITLYSKNEAAQELELNMIHFSKYHFGMGLVFDKNTDAFIGMAGLVYLNHDDLQPDIEIGYILQKNYWGKGFGTELANACIQWGFKNLHVNKLIAVTRPTNKKSQHILIKVGMQFVKKIKIRGKVFFYYEIKNRNGLL